MRDTLKNNQKSITGSSQVYLIIYVLIAVIVIGMTVYLLRGTLFLKRTVQAAILKNELYLNEKLVFTDNTEKAEKWLWEFGDGNNSKVQNGTYQFKRTGSYIIRLTVNGDMKIQFPVTVRDSIITSKDTLLQINGPTSGIVNEEIRLEAVGGGEHFEWSFGETGRVDVNGRTALYTFHKPGRFIVQLNSDKNRPLNHIIYVNDPRLDSVVVVPGEGEKRVIEDIRTRLQAIADGKDFNSNYYYLLKKYMCGNEHLTVGIEQDGIKRTNDFYIYCIGLTFGGEIYIDQAQVTVSPNASCATLLTIQQHSAKAVKK